jgi:hypothetical protein
VGGGDRDAGKEILKGEGGEVNDEVRGIRRNQVKGRLDGQGISLRDRHVACSAR